MKKRLIEDLIYFDTVLEEAKDDKGELQPYLLINNMVADVVNANGREYPLSEVESALKPFTEDVKQGLGSAIMLADHPIQGTPPSIKDAAGFIKEVYLDPETKTVKLSSVVRHYSG